MKPSDKNNGLSQSRLKELFSYDAVTGLFTRNIKVGTSGEAGSLVGTVNTKGYLVVRIDNKPYLLHRLAWLYVTGEWPSSLIDHINQNKGDNSFANLREANQSENMQNRTKPTSRNKSGYLGVSFRKDIQKFSAEIWLNYKKKSLGCYDTAEEASEAYLAAKRQIHSHCTA
jgi:hypothetical protein